MSPNPAGSALPKAASTTATRVAATPTARAGRQAAGVTTRPSGRRRTATATGSACSTRIAARALGAMEVAACRAAPASPIAASVAHAGLPVPPPRSVGRTATTTRSARAATATCIDTCVFPRARSPKAQGSTRLASWTANAARITATKVSAARHVTRRRSAVRRTACVSTNCVRPRSATKMLE